jgi:SAM-dependent methyltransferase
MGCWPWPLPALVAWGLAWSGWWLAQAWGLPLALALALGMATGATVAAAIRGRWRQLIAAAGFPMSAWALGASAVWPGWAWLALMLPLLLAYPLRAWRDAPFFPTPPGALMSLAEALPAPSRVLDAGCGLGHGLRALRRSWPKARLEGVEWSPLLAFVTRVRCPWATVSRGDMWAADWHAHDLVYVFQRPESMARVWSKACAEMRPDSWLVSLEFAVDGVAPWACLQREGQRPVWIYRPKPASPGSTAGRRGR